MTSFQALVGGIQEATDALVKFTIVVVDEVTPAFEELIVALLPFCQWAEVRRMVDGEIEPFSFREAPE